MTTDQITIDILLHEILPRLIVKEIYAYCGTTRDSLRLYDDLSFWCRYLASYDHEQVQTLVLRAGEGGNRSFVRLVMNNSHRLNVTIDSRTLLRIYYAAGEQGNVELASCVEQILDEREEIPWSHYHPRTALSVLHANLVPKVATTLKRARTDGFIDEKELGDLLNEFVTTGLPLDYLARILLREFSGDALWLLDIEYRRDGHDENEYLTYLLREELFIVYIDSLTVKDTTELLTTLERVRQRDSNRFYHYLSFISQNASYAVYLTLSRTIDLPKVGSTSDRQLWHLYYDGSDDDVFKVESLLLTAYQAIPAIEWCKRVGEYPENRQERFRERVLKNAKRAGYTAWSNDLTSLMPLKKK